MKVFQGIILSASHRTGEYSVIHEAVTHLISANNVIHLRSYLRAVKGEAPVGVLSELFDLSLS